MPLAEDLPEYEAETIAFHRARGELAESEWGGLDVLFFDPRDRDDYYYAAEAAKQKIVLHYTIGFLGGDLSNLTRDDFHVSVPFVISRGGLIIQLFDPKYWSYHLSPGAVGGNKYNSRASVPIELSNIGPLERNGNWMWNYYGDRYCHVDQREYYIDLGVSYRGYQYFATFTDEQYQVADRLVRKITDEFAIPHVFLPETSRYDLFPSSDEAWAFEGICSHVNFQPPAVKNDIGPAFDWGSLGSHEDDPAVG